MRLDPDLTAKSVKKLFRGEKFSKKYVYIISKVKISIFSDYATKNPLSFIVFSEIYGFRPFLVKNGHFSVTKYFTNHNILPCTPKTHGGINLLYHILHNSY